MEIVSLIVQQLYASVISFLALAPIWLFLLYLGTYCGSTNVKHIKIRK